MLLLQSALPCCAVAPAGVEGLPPETRLLLRGGTNVPFSPQVAGVHPLRGMEEDFAEKCERGEIRERGQRRGSRNTGEAADKSEMVAVAVKGQRPSVHATQSAV